MRRDDETLLYLGLGALAVGFLWDPTRNAIVRLTRTPQDILDAVADVDPKNNPELQPGYLGDAFTWCNKFMYLVLGELGVSIPFGPTDANDQIEYLAQGNDGWQRVQAQDAQAAALNGNVAVATYFNPGGHGHLALILPYSGVMQIAQAGASNFNRGSLASGFGAIQPVFYVHA